jgi:hemoglobin
VVEATQSLYEELGSEIGIRKVVDDFYDRVVADPELAPYFSLSDMAGLRRHQVDFLSAATGGPKHYSGQDIAAAHAGLAITDTAFDLVVGHLLGCLDGFGVGPGTVGRVVEALSPLRPAIVSS